MKKYTYYAENDSTMIADFLNSGYQRYVDWYKRNGWKYDKHGVKNEQKKTA